MCVRVQLNISQFDLRSHVHVCPSVSECMRLSTCERVTRVTLCMHICPYVHAHVCLRISINAYMCVCMDCVSKRSFFTCVHTRACMSAKVAMCVHLAECMHVVECVIKVRVPFERKRNAKGTHSAVIAQTCP